MTTRSETRGAGGHTVGARPCPYCEAGTDERESLAVHLRHDCPAEAREA